MKREFLQNFKVGDTPLPKEIIDAIMTENGNDIEAAKKPFADYDTIKSQLETARNTLKDLEGQDIDTVRKNAADWEEKYNTAIADSKNKIAEMEFNHSLEGAIAAKKGRNAKAIIANLDVETLRKSKNQKADIDTALDELAKTSDYLFDSGSTPPPYSGGTGTEPNTPSGNPFSFDFTGIRETGK